ncbi:synaptonemal complex protein 1 [Helicobacter felis]|uniref:hypothetical protein n=1 Tax=Helicobacter felis TaxID=214 RepID=UPI000CF02F28|nr:hypothetical protein [Helicobacter felis]
MPDTPKDPIAQTQDFQRAAIGSVDLSTPNPTAQNALTPADPTTPTQDAQDAQDPADPNTAVPAKDPAPAPAQAQDALAPADAPEQIQDDQQEDKQQELEEIKALKEQQQKELEEAQEALKQTNLALEQAKLTQERAKEAFKQVEQLVSSLQESQAQLAKSQELQKGAQHALEMAKLITPSELTPLPATPAPTDTPIYQELTHQLTPTEADNQQFIHTLENMLNTNQNWKEQISLCMQGMIRFLSSFENLKAFYTNAQSKMAQTNDTLESRSAFFEAQIDFVKQLVNDYNAYFDEFNAVMNKNNALINRNFDLVLEQIDLVKKLIERALHDGRELSDYKESIELLLAKLRAMQEQKNELLGLHTKSRAYIEEIRRLIDEALQSIQERQTSAINSISSQEKESLTKILAQQQQISHELNKQEVQGVKAIRWQLGQLDQRMGDFESDFVLKADKIQAHLREVIKIRDFLSALEQGMIKEADSTLAQMDGRAADHLKVYDENSALRLKELDDQARFLKEDHTHTATRLKEEYTLNATQLKDDFEANAQTLTQSYDTHAQEKIDELETLNRIRVQEFNDNAQVQTGLFNDHVLNQTQAFDANALTRLNDFDAHVDRIDKDTKAALESLHNGLKESLATNGTPLQAELAGMKKLLEELREQQVRFGANFQVFQATTTQEWTPPHNGLYYYVFVQGGHTGMGSNKQGNPTSFSNLLSANGGSNGQRGECKAAWLELDNAQTYTISIGEGGICVISYATRI